MRRDNGITWIGCLDYARRKFFEAPTAVPPKKKREDQRPPSRVDVALNHIHNKLYAIERRIKHLDGA